VKSTGHQTSFPASEGACDKVAAHDARARVESEVSEVRGVGSAEEEIHMMARTFMGTPWQIFSQDAHAMKISVTLGTIGVIVSEFVASQEGIGYLIKLSSGLLETPLMMAAIIMLSLAGLALYAIIAVAEHRAIYWQQPVEVGANGI
jgi:NitT/TauT family transport system permease protein